MALAVRLAHGFLVAADTPIPGDAFLYRLLGYELANGFAPAGDSFVPDTVLVLRVKTSVAPYKDPAGNPVPETHFTGKGDALVFHGGKVLRGTWTKDGLGKTVTLSTKVGEVKIPAGHVWIELVPKKGRDGTFD